MLIAALWALGHISCASDEACESILSACPSFLEWCTHEVRTIKQIVLDLFVRICSKN